MISFSLNKNKELITEITGSLRNELIPVVEYITVHNRLSVAFKNYLVRIYNESNGHSYQITIEDLEYSSLQINADSIQILLK